jgi:hypothetical protein
MSAQVMQPPDREEVIKAVERKRPSRIPLVRAKWWGEGLWDQYGERLRESDRSVTCDELDVYAAP